MSGPIFVPAFRIDDHGIARPVLHVEITHLRSPEFSGTKRDHEPVNLGVNVYCKVRRPHTVCPHGTRIEWEIPHIPHPSHGW